MDRTTAIEVQELRAALELILNRVEEQLGPTVDLAADHYWTVDARAAYDLQHDPGGSLLAGQLSDDVNAIRDLFVATTTQSFGTTWRTSSECCGGSRPSICPDPRSCSRSRSLDLRSCSSSNSGARRAASGALASCCRVGNGRTIAWTGS
jgi:hypothetical protein